MKENISGKSMSASFKTSLKITHQIVPTPTDIYFIGLFDEYIEEYIWLELFDHVDRPTSNSISRIYDILQEYVHERKY